VAEPLFWNYYKRGATACEFSYRPLPAAIDPVAAASSSTPLLHPELGCNVISDRSFRYGDPETAFASCTLIVLSRCFVLA
jgi:2-furoyl-CoA dehydrogenase large subunit